MYESLQNKMPSLHEYGALPAWRWDVSSAWALARQARGAVVSGQVTGRDHDPFRTTIGYLNNFSRCKTTPAFPSTLNVPGFPLCGRVHVPLALMVRPTQGRICCSACTVPPYAEASFGNSVKLANG